MAVRTLDSSSSRLRGDTWTHRPGASDALPRKASTIRQTSATPEKRSFATGRRSGSRAWLPALPVLASLAVGPFASGALVADTSSAEPLGNAPHDITSSSPAALDLAAHAGKVVYVDFWASWCTPCRASFPWMNALQEELGEDGFVVLGVNTGDDPDAAARFLDEVPAEFGIVDDSDGAIARAYGVEGMPMAYVHDRDGELVASHVGFNEKLAEERGEKIRALVAGDR